MGTSVCETSCSPGRQVATRRVGGGDANTPGLADVQACSRQGDQAPVYRTIRRGVTAGAASARRVVGRRGRRVRGIRSGAETINRRSRSRSWRLVSSFESMDGIQVLIAGPGDSCVSPSRSSPGSGAQARWSSSRGPRCCCPCRSTASPRQPSCLRLDHLFRCESP